MLQHSSILESTSHNKETIFTSTDQKRGEMKQLQHFFLLHTLSNQMWAELWLSHFKKPHPKAEIEELWFIYSKAVKGMDPGDAAEGGMKHVVFWLFF